MKKSEHTNKILALRNKGYGYKRIAKELDVSVGTVRYTLTKVEDDALSGLCKTCGKKMMSIKGKKKKVFCSDKCRYKWWNNKKPN